MTFIDPELSPELLAHLKQYGDRASSFLSSYPGFQTFQSNDAKPGQIRFVETKRAWVAANEPLAPATEKAPLFSEFQKAAGSSGRHAIMVPVTESLSKSLVNKGFSRLQVGVEAVFELDDYFSDSSKDPLSNIPHARALLRRGARVTEVQADQLSPEIRAELDSLTKEWINQKRSAPLQFLNQVAPLRHGSLKKIFILEHNGKIQAFLSAAPIYRRNGFFYADYIRRADSKPGTVELLFIESMRLLHKNGYQEVSLGLCPLARLSASQSGSLRDRLALKFMQWMFNHVSFPLSFRSIYAFKAKLKPSRWDTMYLVSSRPIGFRDLAALWRANLPYGITRTILEAAKQNQSLELQLGVRPRNLPTTMNEAFRRAPASLFLGLFFIALHIARYSTAQVQTVYENYGFAVSQGTWLGWFLGPLFHNTHYHLTGDVLTFWIFGALLEWLFGTGRFLIVAGLGLWASNPVTWAMVYLPLKSLLPTEFARFLKEVDYGSSNAVYAFAGAIAAVLKRPAPIMTPFALNGMFLCLSHQSWLSLHHLVALVMGFAVCRIFTTLRGT